MESKNYKDMWEERKQYAKAVREAGKVHLRRVSTPRGGRIHVICSYNADFVKLAGELAGKYLRATQTWSFKMAQADVLLKGCKRIWKLQDITREGL